MNLTEYARTCKYVAASGLAIIAYGDDVEEVVINARQDQDGGESIAVWELPGRLLGLILPGGSYLSVTIRDCPPFAPPF